MFLNKKLKEQVLQLQEELSSLQQVQRSLDSEMLSVIMDPKGSITAVNSNFEQEMIYSGSQLMGRSWLELVPPYAQKLIISGE